MISVEGYAQSPRERVGYHLKTLETSIQHRESESRIHQLRPQELPDRPEAPKYIPNFGIGDELAVQNSQQEDHICQQGCDLPRAIDLREQIRREAAERQISGSVDLEAEKKRLIEEFKRNAAKKGVRVIVDPESMTAKEAP
jgi:hypothetical protein